MKKKILFVVCLFLGVKAMGALTLNLDTSNYSMYLTGMDAGEVYAQEIWYVGWEGVLNAPSVEPYSNIAGTEIAPMFSLTSGTVGDSSGQQMMVTSSMVDDLALLSVVILMTGSEGVTLNTEVTGLGVEFSFAGSEDDQALFNYFVAYTELVGYPFFLNIETSSGFSDLSIVVVPEPSTWASGLGLAALLTGVLLRRRKSRGTDA